MNSFPNSGQRACGCYDYPNICRRRIKVGLQSCRLQHNLHINVLRSIPHPMISVRRSFQLCFTMFSWLFHRVQTRPCSRKVAFCKNNEKPHAEAATFNHWSKISAQARNSWVKAAYRSDDDTTKTDGLSRHLDTWVSSRDVSAVLRNRELKRNRW